MFGKIGIFVLIVLLNACASIPQPNGNQLVADKPLETVTEEQGRSVSRYLDAERLSKISRYALPDIALSLPAENPDISPEQLALISNALNR